jgi:hypothetical protein
MTEQAAERENDIPAARLVLGVVVFSFSRDGHYGPEREGTDTDVGNRLKQFRELKGLSQGKIERRTGLLRLLHLAGGERTHRSLRRDP